RAAFAPEERMKFEGIGIYMGTGEKQQHKVTAVFREPVNEQVWVTVTQKIPVALELAVIDTLGNVLQQLVYHPARNVKGMFSTSELRPGTYYLKCYRKGTSLQYIVWLKR